MFTSGHTVLSFYGISNFINNSADYGGAISTSGHTILSFNGINNFINNSVDGSGGDGGGAIFISGHTILHFNGTSNFINNSAGLFGFNSADGGIVVVQSIHTNHTILYLASMESAILSTTQQTGAVQSPQ